MRAAVLSHCVYVCVFLYERALIVAYIWVYGTCVPVCVCELVGESKEKTNFGESQQREKCAKVEKKAWMNRGANIQCVCVGDDDANIRGDKCRAKSKVQELCAPARLRRRCRDAALLYDALLGISWRTWRDTVAPTATPPVIFLLICFGCCFFSSCSARESC